MALEFTEHGKKLILWNMFGGLQSSGSYTNWPTLGGYASSASGQHFLIHFFGGTRPSITDTTALPRAFQTSAYTGSTKLWPQGSTVTSISSVLNAGANTTTYPTASLTIDWANNSVQTTASSVASGTSLLFAQGTVTWFAVYGGFYTTASHTTGSGYLLCWTGTVGVTGSGADIEVNRVDLPSANYPVEIKKFAYKFPQPSAVDVIFSKNIYTTALANIIGGGAGYSSGTIYHNIMVSAASANTKYVWTGSGVNQIQFYSGTRPASPDVAVPGDATLIGTVSTFGMRWDQMTQTTSTSEVSLAKTGPWTGSSVATGTPTWCRILTTNSGGTAAIDCSAGLAASNPSVVIQDAITSVGQQINVTSIKFVLN